jgi:hypothetical protein
MCLELLNGRRLLSDQMTTSGYLVCIKLECRQQQPTSETTIRDSFTPLWINFVSCRNLIVFCLVMLDRTLQGRINRSEQLDNQTNVFVVYRCRSPRGSSGGRRGFLLAILLALRGSIPLLLSLVCAFLFSRVLLDVRTISRMNLETLVCS